MPRQREETPLPATEEHSPAKKREEMKLGMIITRSDAETVFNALRLALYSLEQGDHVRIFLSGRGVEID
jgi:hypothetical protein